MAKLHVSKQIMKLLFMGTNHGLNQRTSASACRPLFTVLALRNVLVPRINAWYWTKGRKAQRNGLVPRIKALFLREGRPAFRNVMVPRISALY